MAKLSATPAEHERFCALRALALYGPDYAKRVEAQSEYANLTQKIEKRQHLVDSIITVALDIEAEDGDVGC
jgi:hypothetical protein